MTTFITGLHNSQVPAVAVREVVFQRWRSCLPRFCTLLRRGHSGHVLHSTLAPQRPILEYQKQSFHPWTAIFVLRLLSFVHQLYPSLFDGSCHPWPWKWPRKCRGFFMIFTDCDMNRKLALHSIFGFHRVKNQTQGQLPCRRQQASPGPVQVQAAGKPGWPPQCWSACAR